MLASAVMVAVAGCAAGSTRSKPADAAGASRHRSPTTGARSATAPPRALADAPPANGGTGRFNVYSHTLPGDMSPAVSGLPERVYVPDSESASVDVIDPRTFRV